MRPNHPIDHALQSIRVVVRSSERVRVLQLKGLTGALRASLWKGGAIDKQFKRQIGFPARVIGSDSESGPTWRKRTVCRRRFRSN